MDTTLWLFRAVRFNMQVNYLDSLSVFSVRLKLKL